LNDMNDKLLFTFLWQWRILDKNERTSRNDNTCVDGKKTGEAEKTKQSKEERLTLSMRKLKDINKKINKILIILL